MRRGPLFFGERIQEIPGVFDAHVQGFLILFPGCFQGFFNAVSVPIQISQTETAVTASGVSRLLIVFQGFLIGLLNGVSVFITVAEVVDRILIPQFSGLLKQFKGLLNVFFNALPI